jgi:hypothetical protein
MKNSAQDLIASLVNELGVNQTQAQGGAGAIFKAAQQRLGGGQFEQLLGGIPGVKELLSKAPNPGSGGGLGGGLSGMLGGFASMAGRLGVSNDAVQGAQLLAAFSSLGLNKDTLMKFIPIVLKYLETHGGADRIAALRAALKL